MQRLLLSFLTVVFFPLVSAAGSGGIIIYTANDNGSDDLSVSAICTTLEEHSNNYIVSTPNDSNKRLMRPQVKAAIHFIDWQTHTIADSKAFNELKNEFQRLQGLSKRFPQHAAKWQDYQNEISNAITTASAGNALVKGQWISLEKLQEQSGMNRASIEQFSVKSRSFSGVRLSSVEGVEVGITHSSGATRLPLIDLSAEQVQQLNTTNEEEQITSARIEIARMKDSVTAADIDQESLRNSADVSQYFAPLRDNVTAEAKVEIQKKRDEISEIRGLLSISEIEFESIRTRIGRFRTFFVLQKLVDPSFDFLRTTFGDNLYEVRFPNGEFAIVATPYTKFLTSGRSSMFLHPVEITEVMMVNGFSRDTIVFRESDPEDLQFAASRLTELEKIDGLNYDIESIERELEERLSNLTKLESKIGKLLAPAEFQIDMKLANSISEAKMADPAFESILEALREGDFGPLLIRAGMASNADLTEDSILDQLSEALKKMEVTFQCEVAQESRLCVVAILPVDPPGRENVKPSERTSEVTDVDPAIDDFQWLSVQTLSGSGSVEFPVRMASSFLFVLQDSRKPGGGDSLADTLNEMWKLKKSDPKVEFSPSELGAHLLARVR